MKTKNEIQEDVEASAVKLAPRLRFPKFRDAGEWDVAELGEVTEFVRERIPIEQLKLTNYVSTENILPDYMGVTKASKLPSTGSATKFRPNDTLVSNIRPYLKKVWLADKDGGASNDVIVIRANSRLLDQFFPFLLKNDAFINYIMVGAKGVKMPRGDVASMKEYPAFFSSLPEQQKIADCLSSLDSLITAHNQKLDALKTHKKGLMQQLFPAEGETVPRLRFPEFRDAGEWEKKPLGNICNYWNGSSHEGAVIKNGEYFLISLNSIDIDGILKSDMKRLSYTDNSLKKNDMVMVLSDVAHGNFLGLTDIIPNNMFVLNQRMAGLRIKDANAYNVFFLRAFINKNQKYFKRNGQGSSQLNLAKSAVTEFPVLSPKIREQQKIADYLSTLDSLITTQTNKIEVLKSHKKALMQQMFPVAEGFHE